MTSLLLALLLAQPASPDAITVKVRNQAMVGEAPPSLELRVVRPIRRYTLKLRRSDGKTIEQSGALRVGAVKVFALPQPPGKLHYTGALTVDFGDGEEGELPVDFDAEVRGPPKITVLPSALDERAGRLTFTVDQPLERATATIQFDDGATITRTTAEAAPPGQPVALQWEPRAAKVMSISLKATDTASYWSSVEISPWRIDIPHEDVHFETSSATIPPAERTKLAETVAKIAAALAKYGRLAPIKLYVVGHTDTVGDDAANDALSRSRARAIATWLRRSGIKVPIFYDGLGERALAVPTADQADEPRNRRAEYILAIEPPEVGNEAARPRWSRL